MPTTQNSIPTILQRHKFRITMCPFVERLYRTSLIVTGSPRAAANLLQKIYRKAWLYYETADHIADFAIWLARLVSQNFIVKPH